VTDKVERKSTLVTEHMNPHVSEAIKNRANAEGTGFLDVLIKRQEDHDRDQHMLHPESENFLIITGDKEAVIIKAETPKTVLLYIISMDEFLDDLNFHLGGVQIIKDDVANSVCSIEVEIV
jgi:hypothetical protein